MLLADNFQSKLVATHYQPEQAFVPEITLADCDVL